MKQIINTDKAPFPIGPYNQAVLNGNTLYTSGQIAMDATSGKLYTNSIQEETKKVMQNLKFILEAAGMDFSNVVKATIFLSDMNNFAKVNEIYGNHFDEANAPARETVEVAALPKGANVEISVIAVQ